MESLSSQNVQTLSLLSLRSLGHVFIKNPVYMLQDEARKYMDATFSSRDTRRTYELVKVFVVSEALCDEG